MTTVNVNNQNLTELPVISDNTTILLCYNNQLTILPEKLPSKLTGLDCSRNRLTKLPAVLPSLIVLACFNNPLTELPYLPHILEKLWCNGCNLIKLPPIFPPTLKLLNCDDIKLHQLPDNLPNTLKELSCCNNQLTSLPDVLPKNLNELMFSYNNIKTFPVQIEQLPLTKLWCSYNELTLIPDVLPPTLEDFSCAWNALKYLPMALPSGLKKLCCNHTLLKRLPANLPAGLKELNCSDNCLTILPDLPSTLELLTIVNNPLIEKYPQIDTFLTIYPDNPVKYAKAVVEYVNQRNILLRAQARNAVWNHENKILECYAKRTMHPNHLLPLIEDDTMDIDEYMTNHIDNL